ncbi:MAG: anthranilate synthase component I [Pseudobacteriovorax sp.]|nr:anthranilate synthase component I [Pseudobacteriovorax sp.]
MSIYPGLEQAKLMAGREFNFIPLGRELPSDTLTPVSIFLRLRQTGSHQAFLLESADGGEEVGRYSFLGIDPFASLRSHQNRLVFTAHESNESTEVPTTFSSVETFLQKYKSPKIDSFPPFIGGAVGYVSYDAIRYLEDIAIPENTLGTDDIRLMFFRDVIAFDRLKHRLYLVTHIPQSENFEESYENAILRLNSLTERILRPADNEILDIPLSDMANAKPVAAESDIGRDEYCEGVRTLKKHIRKGDIFQGVLSDRFSFDYDGDPFLTYRILRMINPSPYLFYLDTGDEVLLGSSPEMLIRTTDSTVETCPIAGTRPRGETQKVDLKMESDLLASVKEKAEHLMLVDLGRNDIGRVSRPGTVRVKDFMKVERYSHVMHLVSLVEGKLKKNISPWQALGSCFPAGTLTGAPKIRAMQIISELEKTARGPYGGAIVCQNFTGDLNSCITIRSLLVKDGKGYVQAGAGVVADSSPQKEYEEVLNKSKAIRTAVSIAQSIEEQNR